MNDVVPSRQVPSERLSSGSEVGNLFLDQVRQAAGVEHPLTIYLAFVFLLLLYLNAYCLQPYISVAMATGVNCLGNVCFNFQK